MSRNWIAPKCKYTIEGNHIVTDGTHREKISGTSLGAIIGKSPYGTPFTTTTKLLGVWGEDISDKPAVRTGTILEERIIDYQQSKHRSLGNFMKASELFDERSGDHALWTSDFEDDVFSGHVDGIISKDGKDYILEVKTASRRQIETKGTWINGVPEHYLWQVYLYNHFITKQDKAYFLLGIVDESTYADPYSWIPNKENCRMFEVPINQEMVAARLDAVRQMYAETVGRGVSSVCTTDPLDMEIMSYLKDISGTTEELNELTAEYVRLKKANKEYMDLNKSNIDKEESIKERIKAIMSAWNMTANENVQIRTSVRKSFDFNLAEKDNLDVSKYTKINEIKTLNVKKE